MKNEHKHFIARLLVWAFIVLWVGFWMSKFVVDASTRSLDMAQTWNNATFLSQTFWTHSTDSGDIVKALYGSGDENTAYTTTWSAYDSGACPTSGILVEYITWWDTIPLGLSGNTIYVLNSGNYITTGMINFSGDCTALVWSGDVYLYSDTQLTGGGMLYLNGKQHIIMDNIHIIGTWGGIVPGHAASLYGVHFEGSSNSTLHHIWSYNFIVGILSDMAGSNNSFSDIQSYNNGYGIMMIGSNNVLNNIHTYNNSNEGVTLSNSSANNAFNNIQSHNNAVGIKLDLGGSNNTFSNVQSHNNTYGFYIIDTPDSILYTTQSYNNTTGMYLTWSPNTTYYGTEDIFGNTAANVEGIWLVAGSDSDYPSFGWTGWTLVQTGNVSWDVMTNPINTLGNYMLSWSWSFTSIKWAKTTYMNTITQGNSYGSGIFTQIQPVLYSWTTLITGWIFDSTKFIWSDTSKATGDLLGLNTLSPAPSLLLTGTSSDPLVSNYSLFGDIDTYMIWETIALWTWVTLKTWLSSYRIITQLFTSLWYFATHFQRSTILDTTSPTFTGLLASGSVVVSGEYYATTWVTITFHDTNLSGAILSGIGNAYYSGTFSSGAIITGDGTYILTVYDVAGNSTGTTFTIDTITPTFTGLLASGSVVVSGEYYATTWVTITFHDTNLSGAILSGIGNAYYSGTFSSGAIITGDGKYILTVYDLAGHTTGTTFTIDTVSPVLTWMYPTSGLNITWTYTIPFVRSWSETNLSWYTLYISGTTFTGAYATWATWYTLALLNDTYHWYVTAIDKAGNTWTTISQPFIVNVPLSGMIALSGVNTVLSWYYKYVSTTLPAYLWSNKNCTYTITGDYMTTITGDYTGLSLTKNITITWADGLKTIYVTLSTGNEYLTATLIGYLDTTAPSAPSLVRPVSWSITSGAFTLAWSTSTDTGIGLSWYQYFVSTSTGFASTVKSWFTTSTWVRIDTLVLGTTGTFYRYVKALDLLGLSWSSSYRDFYYSGVNLTPTSFSFTRVTSARLNRAYISSEETIAWLSSGTQSLATVSRWVLYIDDEEVGTTWYVSNGSGVKIELISSDEYDDLVSSTITIGWFSTTYRVTTQSESSTTEDDNGISTNLSNTEKLQIASIFLTLKDLYTSETTRTTFFTTLKNTIQTRIDDLDDTDTDDQHKIDALQYLYDLIDNYLWGTSDDNTVISDANMYVAPNGRVYRVTYDSTKKTYTSPDFMIKKTFATLEAMKAYIDVNNGGTYGSTSGAGWNTAGIDATRQSAPYIAPNGKSYRLFKTTDGRYSSYNFSTAKYFVSVDALKNHIYQRNK